MEKKKWYQEIVAKYVSGITHTFLLTGNVRDYVDSFRKPKQFLVQLFKNRDIIIQYDRSTGITFPIPSMKQEFMDALNLIEGKGTTTNPALQALNAVSGGGGVNSELPKNPLAALALIEKVLLADLPKLDVTGNPILVKDKEGNPLYNPDGKPVYQQKTIAIIIDYAEMVFPNTDISIMQPEDKTILITMRRWASEAAFINKGHPIILIAENASDVHEALRVASSRIEMVEVPMPDYEDRLEYIQGQGMATEENAPELARVTAALMKLHIEDIKLRAQTENLVITRELVKERKAQIIKQEYAGRIELKEPTGSLDDFGGMEFAKNYCRKAIVEQIRKGNKNIVPMGVLLMGPAGTGKTYFVNKLAAEAGVNFVILKASSFMDQYVGQSERNLEKIFTCVKALAPCFLFIDEIEQMFQRQTGSGNSVGANTFKMLLEFASDTSHRGDIVLFAATNRPDLMDAALKRAGRFDKKIPFLPPEAEDRKEIFQVFIKKLKVAGDIDYEKLTQQTSGYTGAEIEQVILKAQEVAEREDKEIDQAIIEYALSVLRPTTSDIEFMTNLALLEVSDYELLPPKYREMMQNRSQIQNQVRQYAMENDQTGRGMREWI